MSKFDAKSFNERAFGVYMNAILKPCASGTLILSTKRRSAATCKITLLKPTAFPALVALR